MSMQEVLERAMPSRKQRAPGIFFGVLADICAVALLGLSMWLITKAGEQPPILHLTFAIVGVRAFAIGRAALRYMERVASHDAALKQLAQLRAESYSALVPRVPGAIENTRRGEILGTFVDDVDQLQDHPLRVRQPLLVSGIVVGLSLAVIAGFAPLAAVILAACLAVSGVGASWLAARVAGSSDSALAHARAAVVDALLEHRSAAAVLKAFDALPAQRSKIAAAEQHLTRVQLARSRAAGVSAAILLLASGCATLLTLWLLAPAVVAAAGAGWLLSAPVFAAVTVVPAAVFEVYAQVFAAVRARRVVAASAQRVAALTVAQLPPQLPNDTAARSWLAGAVSDQVQGGVGAADPPPLIAVENLQVTHPGASAPAISGVSFTLRAGEVLVISGESGAGKSTLALALTRFLDYAGSYRVRGVEAKELGAAGVREIVGLCEQTPHLFAADLRQNLWFARDTASDEELLAALSRVGLGQWAAERGLDAQLGERGALVSGGQAQRISLARALLADFPVVILDEPTAGVDREVADSLLAELLGAIPAGRAVILITHTALPEGINAKHLRLTRYS